MEVKYSLRLANVSKRFGSFDAVSDVTIAVKPGEVVGFVGPNGAGKTTTISMIMGFLGSSRGKVEVLGRAISPQSAHHVHSGVGYVAGDMVLPNHLTAEQYLHFAAHAAGRDQKRYEQLVHQLSPVLDRPIKNLSRGNKQKIALIAALQHRPKLLILDEPTSGLDPLMQDSFLQTIRHEAALGTTVFMSSHILSEVSDVCSRIVFMKNGKFIVDQPITKITEQLGKHVIISAIGTEQFTKFLPDFVTLVSKTTDQVRLTIPTDALKPFMRWLGGKNFRDVTIEDRNLDDVFHELYTKKEGATSR